MKKTDSTRKQSQLHQSYFNIPIYNISLSSRQSNEANFNCKSINQNQNELVLITKKYWGLK